MDVGSAEKLLLLGISSSNAPITLPRDLRTRLKRGLSIVLPGSSLYSIGFSLYSSKQSDLVFLPMNRLVRPVVC